MMPTRGGNAAAAAIRSARASAAGRATTSVPVSVNSTGAAPALGKTPGSAWAQSGTDPLLTRLWVEEAQSYSKIAAAVTALVGFEVGRNAVAGRVSRLGLARRGDTPPPSAGEGGREAVAGKPITKQDQWVEPVMEARGAGVASGSSTSDEAAKPEVAEPPAAIPDLCGLALILAADRTAETAPLRERGTYRLTELRRCQCRFPVTPDSAASHEHRFCGEAVEAEGKPYYAGHAARAFDRRPEMRRAADRQRAAAARLAKAVRRGWGSTGA